MLVGALMISYVLFGGMIATTWVQIIKAVLLLGGATLLVIMVLAQFDFSSGNLFGEAAKPTAPEVPRARRHVHQPARHLLARASR